MLSFRTDYLTAMRDQAPAMFNELRQTGQMQAHLDAKVKEAQVLFKLLTQDEPTLPSGVLRNQQAENEVIEQVYATLIEFPQPSESPEPTGRLTPDR